MTDDSPADIEDRLASLESALEELQAEVRESQSSPSVPGVPSPTQFLRFADQAAIPAMIAILELNIKLLESLRRTIQLSQAGSQDRQGTPSSGRASDVGVETWRRLDAALAELQRTLSGDPSSPAAQRVLEEARSLREDIDDRVEEASESTESMRVAEDETVTTIDVEAELESIKEEQTDPDDEATSDDEDPDDQDDEN